MINPINGSKKRTTEYIIKLWRQSYQNRNFNLITDK